MLETLMFFRTWVDYRLHRDDRGVTAVEYGLLLALIAMVIVVAVLALGHQLSSLFSSATACVKSTSSCPGS